MFNIFFPLAVDSIWLFDSICQENENEDFWTWLHPVLRFMCWEGMHIFFCFAYLHVIFHIHSEWHTNIQEHYIHWESCIVVG